MKIKHIFEDGQVTYYELGEIVKSVTAAIEQLPRSIVTSVTDEEKSATEELERVIGKINNDVVKLLEDLDAANDKVYLAAERYYENSSDTMKKLNDRLSQLPNLRDLYVPTHQMKELLEIAEQCERLSDEQWSRVIELAKALTH